MEKGPIITGQQNTENTKESKETKGKIKIKLAGKEYELEITSYGFEYPKRIQQETGILGYERTIVKEEEILRITKKRLESIGLDTTNCNDFDSLEKLREDVYTSKKKNLVLTHILGVKNMKNLKKNGGIT